MKKLLIFLFCIFSTVCNGDLLLWQVNPEATVAGTENTVYTWLQNHNEIVWNGSSYIMVARVNVYDHDGNLLKTMENTSGPVGGGNSWDKYIDIGYPGSGRTPEMGATATSTQWNNLGRDYYYQMNILVGEKHGGSYVYQEIMWSAMYSGALLEHNGSYDLTYDPHVENMVAWTPDEFYTFSPVPKYDYVPGGDIPEPGTGILMFIGLGLLMLKRKTSFAIMA